MFDSLFESGDITVLAVFLSLGAALIAGVIFAFMCYYRSKSTKSFFISTALLPCVVALVIILVNGNIGVGIAIAGAFSLVRFRSAPGTAKEISVIFITMASGLAFGMGYIGYGSIFILALGGVLMLFERLNIWDKKIDIKEKRLKIVLPEELDYTKVFDDIFEKYTDKVELYKVKTVNMGSMFCLYYLITLKDLNNEKEFMDELRCRNGNLEVLIQRVDFDKSEL